MLGNGVCYRNADMKIVVLDGFTLNPGDLEWKLFESLGELDVYDRTPPSETIRRAETAEAILTNKVVISADMLSMLPRARYIGVLATGYNNVDIEAAAELGIAVTNVPEYSTDSVAQLVFAHLLNLCNRVADHDAAVHSGKWNRSEDFCFWDHPQSELAGQVMGIVGFGRIGRVVARIANAFGMKVLANNRSHVEDAPAYVEMVDQLRVFAESDVVSLHCPLSDSNRGFVDAELLSSMKPGAYLINTSRGPLVNESDLADALREGVIAGAAVDVLSSEPPPPDNPLLGEKRCRITPHLAWATLAARRRLMRRAFENLDSFLHGQAINVVNGI